MIDPTTARLDILDDFDDKLFRAFYRDYWKILKDAGKTLTVVLTSNGGEVWVAAGLVDLLLMAKEAGIRITTIAIGQCNSAAAIVFLVGDERLISPRCQLMFHEGHFTMTEKPGVAAINEMESDNRQDDALLRTVCHESGVKYDLLKSKCKGQVDWWVSPQECVKLKLATGLFLDKKTSNKKRA